MSLLSSRDPNLAEDIEKYPALIQSVISFLTEPACIRLLEAGGQAKGIITLQVVNGQVTAMVPAMELKAGFEIK